MKTFQEFLSESKIKLSGDKEALEMLFGKPKADMSKLPQFKNKPGTKGHLDELLAQHEHHCEQWHIQHEAGAKTLAKYHGKTITALEKLGEKHYYKHYEDLFKSKHKIHWGGKTYGVNKHWFSNQFDNYSNGREGSKYKKEGDAVFDAIRKRLAD